ncbi:hypothetical protein [Catellatospora tritici]|uniref:hypothetical protein n=1 Tax=Catellatospora tritici TaxID=2851566 RepID=UPI001C2CDFAD|nr:hypothetical protein [Catellatospora tritici]MBV1850086.1 hypothetical protein [Catellatospora tritici]
MSVQTEPETEAVSEPEIEAVSEPDETTPTAAPTRRRGLLVPALALLLVLALGAGGYLWYDRQRLRDTDAAARECTALAPAAAAALFSYDYRTFDMGAAGGKSFAAGAFADEYAKTTASLKEAATKEQAVVTAQVTAVSVASAAPDRVELLVFLNQYRRNVNISGEKVDQNRVVLTFTREGGAWKVTAVSAI